MLTLSYRNVRCVTLYCDLDADADWDDTLLFTNITNDQRLEILNRRDSGGNGTYQNPFRNGSYALSVIWQLHTRSLDVPECWPWIRLVCTGTAHYSMCGWNIPGTTEFNNQGPLNNIYKKIKLILQGATI